MFYFQVPFKVQSDVKDDVKVMPPPKSTNIMIGVNKRLNSANANEIRINNASPKSSRDLNSRNVDHNIDAAMEMMDDSFTCSMASQALAMATRTLGNTRMEPKSTAPKSNNVDAEKVGVEANETGLNDSLTFSMIAKVLDSEPPETAKVCSHVTELRLCLHCDGNGIIFIILMLPNVAKWVLWHQMGGIHTTPAFKAQNRRCYHSLNKVVDHHRYYFVLAYINIFNFCLLI